MPLISVPLLLTGDYVEGHQYLSTKTVPKMDVNDAFFVYQWDDNRENLLAQQVSNAQSVVWSTGTHTSTPVLVFAQGPIKAITPFSGILHHTLVGQFVTEALVGPQQ